MATVSPRLAAYLRLLGTSEREVYAGCTSCPALSPAHEQNAADVARLLYVWRALLAPGVVTVRGWYRCRSCNAERGGAGASAHLAASAVDLDLDAAAQARLAALTAQYGWGPLAQWVWSLSRPRGSTWGAKRYSRRSLHIDSGVQSPAEGARTRSRAWLEDEA